MDLTRDLLEVFIDSVEYPEFIKFVTDNDLMQLLFFENLFYHPSKTLGPT